VALRVALKFILLASAAAFVLSAAGSAQADPWVGKWRSVDLDGSNQTLDITRRADGSYDVILFDDRATLCGGAAASGAGVGTVSGSLMTGTTNITCANGQVAGTFPFRGTYNPQSDTFTDGLGVVWSRVRPPAPARATGSVPLGRLVLISGEAPGLKGNKVKATSAKNVLAAAVRPRKLPAFSAMQTQAAHFAKGETDLWSLAFELTSAKAARAAETAVAKAARGSRARVGEVGHLGGKRTAVVSWRHGRVIAAIVYATPGPLARRRQIALSYARVAAERVARAVSRTAWGWALDQIGPSRRISRKAALDLFALAYGPLPGTKRPPGVTGMIHDGSLAASALLRHWATLTTPQRQAALALLGLTSAGPAARTSSAAASSLVVSALGDPGYKVDSGLTELAGTIRDEYASKLGYTLKSSIVAGFTTTQLTALADALSVDDTGNYGGSRCRIRFGPKAPKGASDLRSWLVAYEVFVCSQIELMPFAKKATARPWAQWGTAMWASLEVRPLPWDPGFVSQFGLAPYFTDCRNSLLNRTSDAAFAFGHTQDTLGDMWARMQKVLGGINDDTSVFIQMGGIWPNYLESWASSVVLKAGYSFAWYQGGPIKPPASAACSGSPINGDTNVAVNKYRLFPYVIYNVAQDEPLLHIDAKPDHARLSDGQVDTAALLEAWFCIDGDCECPEGTEGFPPPAQKLSLPAQFALAGGEDAAWAKFRFVSLEDYCKVKQKPPPAPCPLHERTAQRLLACPPGGHSPPGPGETPPGKSENPPDPIQCYGHGCGRSIADPHLSPFDSPWYDFQGAGEFTLVRSTSDDLEVQVRQQPWPGSRTVSQNVAVAMRVGGDRVGVYSGDPFFVRVNGRPVLLGKKDLQLPRGGVIKPLRQGQLDIVWPDASAVRVVPTGDLSTDVIVSLAAGRQGKVRGLLGNNDVASNDADDFTTRGGRQLDPQAIKGTGKRAYNLLYRVFGESWRVTPKSSLFDYAPGQSTRTFTDRRFPSRILSPEALRAQDRKNAEVICRRMRLRDPRVFRNCVLDVASTGFFSFAVSASTAERSTKQATKPAPPPKPQGPRAVLTFAAKTYTYVARKGTSDGCTRDDVGGIAFRLTIGTLNPNDSLPIFDHDAGFLAKKDGTYKNRMLTFEAGGAVRQALDLTVTLAGKRTRGTFSGTAQGSRVAGSFQC
jgi:hypothetical protein